MEPAQKANISQESSQAQPFQRQYVDIAAHLLPDDDEFSLFYAQQKVTLFEH